MNCMPHRWHRQSRGDTSRYGRARPGREGAHAWIIARCLTAAGILQAHQRESDRADPPASRAGEGRECDVHTPNPLPGKQ